MNTVTLYRDEADEWRWRTTAPNGEKVADSGEGYHNHSDCLSMAQAVNGDDPLYVTQSDGTG